MVRSRRRVQRAPTPMMVHGYTIQLKQDHNERWSWRAIKQEDGEDTVVLVCGADVHSREAAKMYARERVEAIVKAQQGGAASTAEWHNA